MRVAIIGQQAFGKSVLEAFIARGHAVAGVFVPPENPGARPDPLKAAAVERQIPAHWFKSYSSEEARAALAGLKVDIAIMAFVTQFVPQSFCTLPPHGTIQFHPSLLPLHRGPSAISWAIINGRAKTGLTIFRPSDGLDEGPVLLRKEVAIGPDDTLGTVYFDRIFPLGVEALIECAEAVVAGGAREEIQDESQATYEGWVREAESRIDWAKHIDRVYDLVRGCNPAPGAWTSFEGRKLYIFDARKSIARTFGAVKGVKIGQVASVGPESFTVLAQGGFLDVLRCRIDDGKKIAGGEAGIAQGAMLAGEVVMDDATVWPEAGSSRVPFELYKSAEIYDRERERVFLGATWNYLCLEAEIAKPGDYRASWVGDVPVVVARDMDGSLGAFENRCAHRGALICHNEGGNGARISCVYHGWTYDLKGNLTAVTFQRGVAGKGGMPADFRREDWNRRKLRVESFHGLVFGTFSATAPPLAAYIGPVIGARVARVMKKPVKVIGTNSQMLPNNWKMYICNVRDPYHASLLHLFFTTFRLNRLSTEGGILLDETGGHHVSFSKSATDRPSAEYDAAELRAKHEGFRLADPSIIQGRDEFGDGITLQILSVFPCFVLQQIMNCLATRQVVPRGKDETELLWTYFGFEDDDEEMALARLKQANLVGPAGYISMEDGAVGSFVRRGITGAGADREILEMGGRDWRSQDTRATESPLRGFWKVYREHMGL